LQLVINRSQQDVKGMMGGHKGVQFTLSYKLVLTADEAALVQRYKLGEYALSWRTIQGNRVPDDTISNMVQGRTQTLTDVTTLLNNEEIVTNACDQLPGLFAVVRSFGGQEVIDYPRGNRASVS
jgi:hypothetical protein